MGTSVGPQKHSVLWKWVFQMESFSKYVKKSRVVAALCVSAIKILDTVLAGVKCKRSKNVPIIPLPFTQRDGEACDISSAPGKVQFLTKT